MGLDRHWRPISIAAQVVILLDTNAVICSVLPVETGAGRVFGNRRTKPADVAASQPK